MHERNIAHRYARVLLLGTLVEGFSFTGTVPQTASCSIRLECIPMDFSLFKSTEVGTSEENLSDTTGRSDPHAIT